MQRASRGQIFAWTLFDFANTGFLVIIVTLIFPVYFTDVIAGGNEDYWGWTISASMLVTALIGPLLGSIADATSRKKRFLGVFTAACVIATVGLFFTGPGTVLLAAALLVIANVGFEGGTIFYDAFLPELVPETDYGRVSGYGFAMGYLGSLISLALAIPLVPDGGIADPATRNTFLLAAAFFGLFSLPLFLNVRERTSAHRFHGDPLREGYRRLRETITHIRRYDDVKRFLLAFFVYNDSILTVIVFAGIFASKELAMSFTELILFFMIVQGSALVGSLVFGALTNRLGARQTIIVTLLIWVAVVIGAYFVTTSTAFFVVGALAGMALGSSQSTSRTMMALLTPPDKKTEFFGFYDGFFGKASAMIGPAVFGVVSSAYGIRSAMLVVGVFFLVGIALVLRVRDARPSPEPAAST
jgi:UMF1 family MFS transporter